jgi:Aspartyl protease/Tetratricopeptide repeat
MQTLEERVAGLKTIGILLIVPLTAIAVSCGSRTEEQPDISSANRLFLAGEFAEAQKVYAALAARDPKDYSPAVQLGHIALLGNRLEEAQDWLQKALADKPGDVDAKIMLAEVYYRRNDFAQAAASLSGLGPQDEEKLANYGSINGAKLESFKGQTPYELVGAGESTRLQFVKTEPLPLVKVRVNGGKEVIFFIDTGGPELLLDKDFAQELGVKPLGSAQGTFSGGQHVEVHHGRIDSLTLGDWTVKNVPVGIMPLRSLSQDFGIPQLNGCVGTNVLYQFLSTIDYPAGGLILRRKAPNNLKQFEASATGRNVVVPFWMAGDHFMVASGRIDALPPTMLFIDTGLAGAGVKLAESVLKQANIQMEQDEAYTGAGGGGALRIVPYHVNEVSLGEIHEKNVAGLYDGPFPWENAWGFHVAGMVGHDFFRPYAVTFDFTGMRVFLR